MRGVSRRCGLVVLMMLALLLPAVRLPAQDQPRAVAVHEGGSVLVKGQVRGYTGATYVVRAEAGQQMQVSLHTRKGATSFNVRAPGSGADQEAIFRGEVGGDVADVKVAQTGEYRIEVYQMRSFARRGTVADFSLTIALRR